MENHQVQNIKEAIAMQLYADVYAITLKTRPSAISSDAHNAAVRAVTNFNSEFNYIDMTDGE